MIRAAPALLVAGDPRHGVVRFARQLAEAVEERCGSAHAVDLPAPGEPLHVHVTDRLWGTTPAAAATRLGELALGRRLTVTLHDVPQRSDGVAWPRRRAGYRAIVATSAGVVVSSEHERALLREQGIAGERDRVTVIPLPVIAPAAAIVPARVRDEVALLGFVYPGKGHTEAIDAVAELPAPRPAVRALGTAAAGHADEITALRAHAERRAVRFGATGWLSDTALRRRAREARIPLAAHGHVSASGSINSWIAAGRVPLVRDSRYARELERLRPGTIRRYPASGLAAALAEALGDARLCRLAPGLDTRPHLADAAASYLRFWAAL